MSIKGILPVVPTPFHDGRFDASSFERLLAHGLEHLDGYTLLGSTGEAPSMTLAERMEIAEAAIAMTPDDKTVIVGITHTCSEDAVTLARHAQSIGARGVLCAMPYYFANEPAGALEYLRAIDEAIEIDLVLYDNPVATKTTLHADTVIGWSRELRNLKSVKLTDHALEKVGLWREAGLSVLAGDDPILFRYLEAGTDGVMVIVPAIFPATFRRCFDLVQQGELAEAYAVLARHILPFSHVFGIGDEIATTKAMLKQLGIFTSDEVRPPLVRASDRRRKLLQIAYDLSC